MSNEAGGGQHHHHDEYDPSFLWKSSAEERLLISSLDLEMEVELAKDQSEGSQNQSEITPEIEGTPVEGNQRRKRREEGKEGREGTSSLLLQARQMEEAQTDIEETPLNQTTAEEDEEAPQPPWIHAPPPTRETGNDNEREEENDFDQMAGGFIVEDEEEMAVRKRAGQDHDATKTEEEHEEANLPEDSTSILSTGGEQEREERGKAEEESRNINEDKDQESPAPDRSPTSTSSPLGLRVPSFPLIDSEDLPADHGGAMQRKKPFDLSRFEKAKQTVTAPAPSRSIQAGKRSSSTEAFDPDEIPIRVKDKDAGKHKETATRQLDPRAKEPLSDNTRGDKFRVDLEKMKERTEFFLGLDLDREIRSASQEDFQSPPRPKKPRNERFDEDKDEEESSKDQKCTICLERYNNGTHRAVNLKCGHVFAKSCIEKWLANLKTQRCPNCNARAQKRDIRLVIPLVLVADDTMERERARNDLAEETKKVNEGKLEASKWKSQYNKAKADAEKLREQVELLVREKYDLSAEIEHMKRLRQSVAESQKRFAPWNSQVVSKEKNAKLLAYDRTHELLLVSKSLGSMSGTERPSGFAKVSLLDPRNMPFVKVHSQPIKDIKCSPRSDTLVLSTSLDKTLKITNLLSGAVCHTFHLDQAGWSCSWDPVDPNSMIVGLQNNVVLLFDIRKTSTFVKKLDSTRRSSKPLPIHSLTAIRGCSEGTNTFPRGIIVGTPENAFFWSHKDGTYEMNSLEDENVPGRNSCSFVDFDPSSQRFLVSYRSDEARALPRYLIGSINEEGRLVYEQMVEGASQQKGMVKSLVFSCPSSSGPKHQATIPLLGTPESSMAFAQVKQPQPQSESKKRSASDPTDQSSKLFLAAGDAGSSSLLLWDLKNAGASPNKLESKQKQVIDVKAFFAKEDFLAALSEDELFLYSCK